MPGLFCYTPPVVPLHWSDLRNADKRISSPGRKGSALSGPFRRVLTADMKVRRGALKQQRWILKPFEGLDLIDCATLNFLNLNFFFFPCFFLSLRDVSREVGGRSPWLSSASGNEKKKKNMKKKTKTGVPSINPEGNREALHRFTALSFKRVLCLELSLRPGWRPGSVTLEAESDVFLRIKSLRVAVTEDKIDESDTTGERIGIIKAWITLTRVPKGVQEGFICSWCDDHDEIPKQACVGMTLIRDLLLVLSRKTLSTWRITGSPFISSNQSREERRAECSEYFRLTNERSLDFDLTWVAAGGQAFDQRWKSVSRWPLSNYECRARPKCGWAFR